MVVVNDVLYNVCGYCVIFKLNTCYDVDGCIFLCL